MELFGRYELVKRIGVGGMAEIFLARSASLDGFEKELVIKRVRPELGKDEKFSSMFIDEGRISIGLSHPNIVQVFDFGELHGTYYLAMEYVDGCDLAKVCQLQPVRQHGLEPALALIILGELLRALEYAHTKKDRHGEALNVIHRDVSPQNVIISFDGGLKLTDFGIAKARGRVSQTNPGIVLGKLAYMSPEQLRGEDLDHRTDIFSCGVVLWELLVGRSLFGATVKSGVYEKILQANIDPPSSKNPRLPPEIDALVMRALAKERHQRYGSAREFFVAVHDYLVHHHPSVNSYNLQSFLEEQRETLAALGNRSAGAGAPGAGATRPTPNAHLEPGATPTLILAGGSAEAERPTVVLADPGVTAFDWSPDLIGVVESFHRRPSLWHLVRMGEICGNEGHAQAALTCYRVAAVKFAQRGLLAQALFCAHHMLETGEQEALAPEIAAMPTHVQQTDETLQPALWRGQGAVEDLLGELLSEVQPTTRDAGQPTPLLSHLDGPMFAELAQKAPLLHFAEGRFVVEQGEAGRTMYLVARGRALVHAMSSAGQRVYLSSLTAGDFFGENGFFTAAPRSATVEALYPLDVFEIDRELYARTTLGHPAASGILLQFYKERIVETVLAKSPVFGELGGDERRALVNKFVPRVFRPGELVINEGAHSDHIYIVKEGEAEVFTQRGEERTVLSRIGPGTLFGELAALRGIPRTASVMAKSKLELLELGARDFHALLDCEPGLKQRVLAVVMQRARDNMDKLVGGGPGWNR